MISSASSILRKFAVQKRVIWALLMREIITRYGREGLGLIWLIAEPSMFIVGVAILFSFLHAPFKGSSVAEYLAVSYPTLLFWRNGANRVTKAIESNRSLLHHRPVRPIDIIYARIILEFSSAFLSFMVLYCIFTVIHITRLPYDVFTMLCGFLLVIWFSFAFVLIMSSLSELSESIERVSHIILYFMLPFTGVFMPAYTISEPYRDYVLLFPLVDAVEYFHKGYFGAAMPTYYHMSYTLFALLAMTIFGYSLSYLSIKRVKLS